MTGNGMDIQPLSAEELARIPPTPENPPEDQRAALRRRIIAETAFLNGELEHAKQRIAALNIKPSSIWSPDIRGYEAVHCMCGAPLSVLVESEEPLRTRTIGNKIVITKMAVMHATPHYCTVLLAMADGGEHETVLCRKCARAAVSGDANLEAIYLRDVAQWMLEPDGKMMAARNARRMPLFARFHLGAEDEGVGERR